MIESITNSYDSVWVGKNGPLLIAEIGGNHEGNFDKANYYLDLAIQSGVDCVKFQLYSGDTLVNKKLSLSRNQHFKKFELSKDQHIELAQKCLTRGVKYNASVWDLSQETSVGNVSANVTGTSMIPAIIIPIPILARTQSNACDGLSDQIVNFFSG